MHKDFQKYNPFREPDWRFDRVLQLAERQEKYHRNKQLNPDIKQCRVGRNEDQYIRDAKAFVLSLRKLPEEERHTLFGDNPGLYYAYLLHDEAEDVPRMHTQARLLAGQSDAEIAEAVCTLPSTIEWYEALFFNVRDRLVNKDWILHTVLSPSLKRGVIQREYDAPAKMYGYFGGPIVLDAILSGFNVDEIPDSKSKYGDFMDQSFITHIRRRSAITAMQFETNKYNWMQLFEIHTRLMEMERNADLSGQIQNSYEKNIDSLFKELSWSAGTTGPRAMPANSPLRMFDGMAAQPRADELYAMASGQLQDLPQRLAMQKLPPPRKVETDETTE